MAETFQFEFTGDSSSVQRALADLDKRVKVSEQRVKSLDAASAQFGRSMQQSVRGSSDAVDTITRQLARQEQQLKANADAVYDYGKAYGDTSRQVESFGDAETNLRAVTGAVGYLGGGAGQQFEAAANVAAEIFASAEALPRLGQALTDVGQKVAGSAGAMGKLSGVVATAVPGLTGAAAGLTAIGIAVLPLAAIALAAGTAISELNRAYEASKNTAEQNLAVLEARYAAEAAVSELMNAGRTEELRAQADAQFNEIATKRRLLADLYAQQDELEAQWGTAASQGSLTWMQEIGGQLDTLNPRIDELATELGVMDAEMATYNEALASNEFRINELTNALNAQNAVVDEQRTKLDAQYASLEKLGQQYLDTQAAFAARQLDIEEDRARQTERMIQDYAVENLRSAQDKHRAELRAAEDLARELESKAAEHADALATIEASGQQKILDLRKALSGKEAETLSSINAALADYAARRADVEANYNRAAVRRLEDFEEQRRRIEEDNAADRLDAIINNDISQLRKRQQDQARANERALSDFDKESNRRAEDHQQALADMKAQTDARVAEMNRELAEFRVMTAEKIAAQQGITQQELEAAQRDYDERMRLDQERRDREAARQLEDEQLAEQRRTEDRQRQRQRQLEDWQLADSRALEQHQAALDRIRVEHEAQTAAYNEALDAFAEMERAAAQIRDDLNQEKAEYIDSRVPSQDVPVIRVPAFAKGGIVTSPTLALIGEAGPEMVTPLNSGQMNAGGNVTVNVSPQITVNGGGLDPDELSELVTGRVVEVVVQGISQARNNPRIGF